MDPSAILNFDAPFDVGLFDQVVMSFFTGDNQARQVAQPILVQFREHPQAWTRVDAVLEHSSHSHAKLIALGILESSVRYRWKALPVEQKNGIRNFTLNLIMKLASDPSTLHSEAQIISKLNRVIVEIVKHEWLNWTSFIPDLVHAAKTNESLCANSMLILQILSEEIFDYSSESMTQAKIQELKTNFYSQFRSIFEMCEFVLSASQDPTLLTTTLRTLLRFLVWIPIGFIYETNLIETLAVRFFPTQVFQNDTLRCLSEIGSIKISTEEKAQAYSVKFVQLFHTVIQQVTKLITPETNVAQIYQSGNPGTQTFLRHLTIFITGCLSQHLPILEGGSQEHQAILFQAFFVLLQLSKVDDRVIFKICLEYWSTLVQDLYQTQRSVQGPGGLALGLGQLASRQVSPRLARYQKTMSSLRCVMIEQMSKPEEVIIVEDEYGQIVRETLKDSDSIALYNSMRDCLMFLTHLDPMDTQNIMLSKLTQEDQKVNNQSRDAPDERWQWKNLNTLCWAIGSISGAFSSEQEKRFLVIVIRDLLHMCDRKKGKAHKAVIASNIMYVVGQYPRFLKQHWNFLRTVVTKLFEFMSETHPGVQDMSCDTFLKICRKCQNQFVVTPPRDQGQTQKRPFINVILRDLPKIIKHLQSSQIHTFYHAVGEIVRAEHDPVKQEQLLRELMTIPNQEWKMITAQASSNIESLWDIKTINRVVLVLTTNHRVASSVGPGYSPQLANIYVEVLQVYNYYSQYISNRIAADGAPVAKTVLIKSMRSVKKETLRLMQTFIKDCPDTQLAAVYERFIPALIDMVLDDYKVAVPDARDAEVMLLFTAVIDKLKGAAIELVGRVFAAVFGPTLDMIKTNFEDYPDHRVMFFKLIQSILTHAFPAVLQLSAQECRLVVDSIVWAFQHLERNVADTGLTCLATLVDKISRSSDANTFFQTFYLRLINELFGVLTDTFHKANFKLHAQIIARFFAIVSGGLITVPLWEGQVVQQQFTNNQDFVTMYVCNLLKSSFPHCDAKTIQAFVVGCFQTCGPSKLNQFKRHVRDFLVQLKEFSAEDNSDLYLEEQERQAKLQSEQKDQSRF